MNIDDEEFMNYTEREKFEYLMIKLLEMVRTEDDYKKSLTSLLIGLNGVMTLESVSKEDIFSALCLSFSVAKGDTDLTDLLRTTH